MPLDGEILFHGTNQEWSVGRAASHGCMRMHNRDVSELGTAGRFVGQAVVRKEDPRLLTGHGRYTDDVVIPGALHAHFVRSDLARARITRIEITKGAPAFDNQRFPSTGPFELVTVMTSEMRKMYLFAGVQVKSHFVAEQLELHKKLVKDVDLKIAD